MRTIRKFYLVILVLMVAPFLTSCYINETVRSNEVGVQSVGGKLVQCYNPGVYSSGSFFADLLHVSRDTVTFSVEDPEVATSDNQLVGLRITIQARRREDCESIKGMLTNWSHLVDDARLVEVVTANAREGMKNGTRTFTLTQLLDDRNGLSTKIAESIETDANKYHVDVINVTVENIAISQDYASALQQKALYTAQTEAEKNRQQLILQNQANNKLDQEQRQVVLDEQLKAEQKQTDVQVEIASREGEVIAEQNQIYYENERAYELRRLELLRGVVGAGTVYFLPEGTDLTMLFSPQSGQVVPVPVAPDNP